MIEQWYEGLATSIGRSPVYFAEKFLPGHIPNLGWELFPNAKELFLVRDWRDMFASILAFSRKRGMATGFGLEFGRDDATYVEFIRRSVERLVNAWQARRDRAHLIRYEDLVTRPDDVVVRLLEYLALPADPEIVRNMITSASADSAELTAHRTTDSVESSIGRWSRDLGPALGSAVNDAFKPYLEEFGFGDRTAG